MKSISSQKNWLLLIITSFVGSLIFWSCSSNTDAKPNLVYKDPPAQGAMAKINGDVITLEELVADAKVAYIDIKKKEHEFLRDQLNKIMKDRLIGAEAKKAKMTLDEFIEKKVTKGKINISKKEYEKFVEEKKIPKSQINDQLKERINAYLQEQKKDALIDTYLAKLTKSNPVEIYFKKPKMNIQVELGNAPVWGKKDAKVTIVEFSDFQCPFCSRGAETIDQIKKKYGNKIKLVFKHFPLSFHKEAKPAAEAAMCVNEQDSKKFWKYHDILFENQRALTEADLEKYAQKVGVDTKKWKECFSANKFADFIEKDMAQGDKLGVRSTPTFFINGELVSGALPVESFSEVIDEALNEQGT